MDDSGDGTTDDDDDDVDDDDTDMAASPAAPSPATALWSAPDEAIAPCSGFAFHGGTVKAESVAAPEAMADTLLWKSYLTVDEASEDLLGIGAVAAAGVATAR